MRSLKPINQSSAAGQGSQVICPVAKPFCRAVKPLPLRSGVGLLPVSKVWSFLASAEARLCWCWPDCVDWKKLFRRRRETC